MPGREFSLPALARGVSMAAFAGWLASEALGHFGFGEGLRGAITGVAAFAADDILLGILALTSRMRTDPLGAIADFRTGRMSAAVTTVTTASVPPATPGAPAATQTTVATVTTTAPAVPPAAG